jgi:hypothetical protein
MDLRVSNGTCNILNEQKPRGLYGSHTIATIDRLWRDGLVASES